MKKEVVIVSMARTPIGSFLGGLSSIPAPKLGAIAIEAALKKIQLSPELVDEVFMGNVVASGLGQAPTKQAALIAGIPETVPCTTINKVCSSGMKSVIIGTQSILNGDADVIVAGGMENMSQIPHYLNLRTGKQIGHTQLTDGLLSDGLTDAFDQQHMGTCADLCAKDYQISRKEQDEYTFSSYKRASEAWKNNKFTNEITSVEVIDKKGNRTIINEDEEYSKVIYDKISKLKPAFSPNGTVTAANASTINDGAAAVVLMSSDKAKELNIKPIAKIISYADGSKKPKEFTTAPSKAIPLALKKGGLSITDIDFFEINEAFSVVSLANSKILNISQDKVNINGGAVSLGHPLGMSGTRIIMSLISVLLQNNGNIGAAGICNGGGGASAIVLKKYNN